MVIHLIPLESKGSKIQKCLLGIQTKIEKSKSKIKCFIDKMTPNLSIPQKIKFH